MCEEGVWVREEGVKVWVREEGVKVWVREEKGKKTEGRMHVRKGGGERRENVCRRKEA